MSERERMKDDPLGQLYGVDPDEFVAERKRLAQSLREQGRPHEAEDVEARRKPPLPASLANKLARSRPHETAELIEAAERLAKAHGAGSADDLRNAQDRFRNALRKLVDDLAAVTDRSVSDAVEQRLIATLRAASVDPDMAALLRRGVLSDEIDPAGFDTLAGVPLKRRRESTATEPASGSGQSERAVRNRRARRASLQRELAAARKELRSAERAFGVAERDRDQKARLVAQLEEKLGRERTAT